MIFNGLLRIDVFSLLKMRLKKGSFTDVMSLNLPDKNIQNGKKEILSMVPQGGYWRDLPEDVQREYAEELFFRWRKDRDGTSPLL
jgi:hypothetical protein